MHAQQENLARASIVTQFCSAVLSDICLLIADVNGSIYLVFRLVMTSQIFSEIFTVGTLNLHALFLKRNVLIHVSCNT